MIPVFETVLVEDGRIRLRERHLERLARSGATPEQVAAAAARFDEAVLLTDQPFLLRVDVSDAGVTPSTRPPRPPAPVDLPVDWSYDPGLDERLLKLADRAWAEAIEAAAGGEALLVQRETGLIGEATRSSVMLRDADGAFAVPPLRGILPGVTRAWAVERTGATERPLRLDDLRTARGAVLLTAGRGVVPIEAVEGIALARDPGFDALAEAWRSLS